MVFQINYRIEYRIIEAIASHQSSVLQVKSKDNTKPKYYTHKSDPYIRTARLCVSKQLNRD
jgi:hypothetical protein